MGAGLAKTESAPDAQPSGRLRLFVAGEGRFATHHLPDTGEVTVGRDPGCELVVDDATVAPRHAVLSMGPPVRIADLGSGIPTSVHQHRVLPGHPVEVAPGDILHLGGVILMVEGRGTAPPRRILPHGYFELRLEEECNRAARYHSSFALLRIACDPSCPSAAIEEILANSIRLVDVIAVGGPSDYEVMLVDTPVEDLKLVVSRLETQLAERGGKPRIGIAVYPRDGRSADALLARANGELAPRQPSAEPAPSSGAMQDLYSMVERIAWSDISVLIFGETGVGKERLAEAVHKNSRRASMPFLRLNCAALTETLLESELFGHEKGSFTGAQSAKAGLLESANGGTVFLDEVGDMPMTTQVKLLRVIEERKVRRVGALKPLPIDVRFVAATNRDLELEVSPEVLALLQQYPWPGNIRELRNAIERAVLLCTGDRLELAHLPAEKMSSHFAARRTLHAPASPPGPPAPLAPPALRGAPLVPAELREQLAEAERQRIVEALSRCAGNQTEAAQALGISRRTLVKRLAAFNIPRPRKRQGTGP